MKTVKLIALTLAALCCCMLLGSMSPVAGDDPGARARAAREFTDGNWKDAYAGFSKLAVDPTTDPKSVGDDLDKAVTCLNNLGRVDEIDELIEKSVAAHAGHWQLLYTAARQYSNLNHYGFQIAGEFKRGGHRGGGKYMSSYERDRVRALQLMVQAMTAADFPGRGASAGQFYLKFSEMLNNREAWRLQELTDLSVLPDYEEGYYGRYYGGNSTGAPVQADGTPIYYSEPKNWDAAQNDGERWRWTLRKAMEADAALTAKVRYTFASFLQQQLDVQTLSGSQYRIPEDDKGIAATGVFAVHTLKENETIARLANGVRRFNLPDEFNFIAIFQDVAKGGEYKVRALRMLGSIFENRRQYDRAADYYKLAGEEDKVKQIIGNWGTFERIGTQTAGYHAKVDFRFRNGKKLHLTAYEINVSQLLQDVQAYLKSNPKQLDWNKLQIENIGYNLVQKNPSKYQGDKAAEWDENLTPRPGHFDKRITISTPLRKAGAYFLIGDMDGGNTSRVVLWVADLALLKKPLEGKTYYFVADARTGEPVADARIEAFGYNQIWVQDDQKNGRGHNEVKTKEFAGKSDQFGQLIVGPEQMPEGFSWVVTAKSTGRMAYMGFDGVWYGRRYDAEYNATRTFAITDRPAYRPGQPVKFKFWVNQAKYDIEGKSPFANRSFPLEIHDPKGEKVFSKTLTADDFGGFDGEFLIPEGATLGMYGIHINSEPWGGTNFRVEEYKKPEFEVKVEAPKDPVMLGDKINATIKANYYFGAPVTEAKVTYKVLRSEQSASWYPMGRWDWLFGRGYWWFACDRPWYPGWNEWACPRPIMEWWGGWRPQRQPEVVAEMTVPIGPDGTAPVSIDTSVAKEMFGAKDQSYAITAEVTDNSRRTIVGTGTVIVATKPYKVYAWLDRGHYRVGETIKADFDAHTLDGKPVKGTGELKLLRITYQKDNGNLKAVETAVQQWALDTNEEGRASQQMKADEAGQYRLSYVVNDGKGHSVEGGYLFTIRGEERQFNRFRFNNLEITPDKREYNPGEKVKLLINTDTLDSTVLLFVRPANGVYLPPKLVRVFSQSVTEEIDVIKKDMPNFFIEAVTISNGEVFSEIREIVVPPEKRVLNVSVLPDAEKVKPGQETNVKVRLTDVNGKPVQGSTVISMYDKSLEYIAGGDNQGDIKSLFWKWRRSHNQSGDSSLNKWGYPLFKQYDNYYEPRMQSLGIFGYSVADESQLTEEGWSVTDDGFGRYRSDMPSSNFDGGAPGGPAMKGTNGPMAAPSPVAIGKDAPNGGAPGGNVEPTVRSNFADSAFWAGAVSTDANGEASVKVTMPENLTTWSTRVWAMSDGTRVGDGAAEIITTKNLILRLQAPRFFVQKDEVTLSANVHNFLGLTKNVAVKLELDGKDGAAVKLLDPDTRNVQVKADGEARVDWRVKIEQPGTLVVRMKALTDTESDAMQMTFPVKVHGMLKMESFSGVIRPNGTSANVKIRVPAERRSAESRLEIRYSPTLAGAMVDALPYMSEYPYGCTEQTLNRFLPAALTQKTLKKMGLNLAQIRDKRTNLNAQELGNDIERARQWARSNEPVFDEAEMQKRVTAGMNRLASMQCSDGGWGWFSGYGERSWPHTTAVVVHGLQVAKAAGISVDEAMLQRGIDWLKNYQAQQVTLLKNAAIEPKNGINWKESADALDALVYMVVVDGKGDNMDMRNFLYRDRNNLPVYAKAMFGLALNDLKDTEKRDMIMRNIEQFLVQDDENQTAYLKMPESHRWYWYGSEYEAHAYYLKLLSAVDPKGEIAPKLVKYLINNRKHATYWNSTRDTALVVEAFADYIIASGEDKPNMTVEVKIDGKTVKTVNIDANNLFSFDNKFVLEGEAVTTGEHNIEMVKRGTGPLYFNAYLTNFTLEDPITKAGLEIKVERKFFKLVRVEGAATAPGVNGNPVKGRVEKYDRIPLANLSTVKSGDLVEVQLEIESKNDYEYILFEDMKAAGFEAADIRSGYGGNEMGAYMELRDDRVSFFVRALARGKHSISYRLRAEIPGLFSALPATAAAMYAPELKANSDEWKARIED